MSIHFQKLRRRRCRHCTADSATLKAEMYSFCDLSNIQSESINETFGKCTKTTLQNLYTK